MDDNDLSVLDTQHHEQLVLQACHPRFFASERYLVYAHPVGMRAPTLGSRRVPDGWRRARISTRSSRSRSSNGTLLWRRLFRRTLDVGAFGINAYVARNAGDDVVEEHTERSLGHEEVYVVLSGRATFTLDDETLDGRPRGLSCSSATWT